MSIDPKPCPFCGGDYAHGYYPGEGDHTISCLKCRARMGSFATKKEAVAAWNTRHKAAKAAEQPDSTPPLKSGHKNEAGDGQSMGCGETSRTGARSEQPVGISIEAALQSLIREAEAVADDHHNPRYARLDEALESAKAAMATREREVSGYHTIPVHALLPEEGKAVIVAGGLAKYYRGVWYSGTEEPPFSRPIEWKVEWWMPIPLNPTGIEGGKS